MRTSIPRFHVSVSIIAWLIVPIAWLVARPYRGIRHDATLYMGQALSHIWPDIFANDVFFAHGSQDQYSVFASLIAKLFEWVGVAPVEALVPLIAHAVLMLAAFLLIRLDHQCTALEEWLALVAIAAFPHLYDGVSIFAFAEPFLTARTLAEPLCLLGTYLLLSKRWVLSAVALICAGMMHPLITIPVLFVAWISLCLGDRRWLLAAFLALIPVALALKGTAPFDSLFVQYDALWWSQVEDKNPVVLVSKWDVLGWQTVLFDIGVLALASSMTNASLSRLCKAAVVAVPMLFGLSAVGADLFHNMLVTSLQLWRVMWLTHLLALLVLPLVILRLARQEPYGLMVASAIFLAAVATRWSAGWAFIAWSALTLVLHHSRQPISRHIVDASVIASLTGAVVICLLIGKAGAETASMIDGATAVSTFLAFITTPVAVLAGALSMLWALNNPQRYRFISWVALTAVAGVAVTHWDRRDSWQRYVESSLNTQHPFQKYIEEHQQVYWHDQVQASWLVLKRPSYYSEVQGAGQLFNRGTMEELLRREPEFKGLRLQESMCGLMGSLSGSDVDDGCSPTPDLAEEICLKQPGLDFMVFGLKLPRGLVTQWTFTPTSNRKSKTFYLYDCNKFRKA